MSADGPKLGIAAVAADLDPRLLPLTGAAAAAPAQLGLLDDGEPYEPAEDSTPFQRSIERRGPGRPKGSVNKRTAEFRDYILKRYGDVLTGLAEVAFMRIEDLAAELGCTKLEAFDRWLRCREALMPYVHAKMPTEVAVKAERLPTLVIGAINVGGDQAGVEITGDGVRAMSVAPREQFQGLTGGAEAQSLDGKSHEGEKK